MSFLPISPTVNAILMIVSIIGLIFSIYKWKSIEARNKKIKEQLKWEKTQVQII